MKKILYLMLIVIGIASVVYSVIQYTLIYSDFWKNQQYFINGNLDTILIFLGFIGICLIIVETLALYKIIKKISNYEM